MQQQQIVWCFDFITIINGAKKKDHKEGNKGLERHPYDVASFRNKSGKTVI